ncbi:MULTISPECIES: PorP/SprF family type IX secretion system membrane protein [Flavobacterium]|uniref:PorP/SprF family type IX secretion system membrane protein n=1 Tax=Flavobacterium keumense TaxID=1306518 RepID=A0ABY8N400_9FLAO|nr:MULTISPECIES: PorP/SprF family type IX secretion system membrane protein [Flavobacterium]WGK94382.1 PorP/SprF family type IX secretion system membrane protein [Flavobacterium keumense]
MKKIKDILLVGTSLLFCIAIYSQEQNIFTRYRYHMNIINPAYVGVDGQTLLTSSLRRQWTGVPNGPESQYISFGTPLANNLAIGLSLENNKTFIEKQGFFGLDISYKLQISRNTDMYFGIKAVADFYEVNFSGLNTYNVFVDPSIQSISRFSPNIGVGTLLKGEGWYATFSVPRVFDLAKVKEKEGVALVYTDLPQMYIGAGMDFDISDNLMLKPSLNWNYIQKSPSILNLTTMFSFNDKFEIGANYSTDNKYAALTTLKVSNRFVFGYAYEMSTIAALARSKNTNEILLQFKF